MADKVDVNSSQTPCSPNHKGVDLLKQGDEVQTVTPPSHPVADNQLRTPAANNLDDFVGPETSRDSVEIIAVTDNLGQLPASAELPTNSAKGIGNELWEDRSTDLLAKPPPPSAPSDTGSGQSTVEDGGEIKEKDGGEIKENDGGEIKDIIDGALRGQNDVTAKKDANGCLPGEKNANGPTTSCAPADATFGCGGGIQEEQTDESEDDGKPKPTIGGETIVDIMARLAAGKPAVKRRLGLPPSSSSAASEAKRRREQEKTERENERLRKKRERELEIERKREQRLREEEERRARKKKEEDDRLERRRQEEEERNKKKEQKRLEEEEKARKRLQEEEERKAKRLALEEEKNAKKEARENERIAKEKERMEKLQAKEEETRLKKEEEDARKKEKEAEEDLKRKQSQQFMKFFKKTDNVLGEEMGDVSTIKDVASTSAAPSDRFLSFQPKEGMHLAPYLRRTALEGDEKIVLDRTIAPVEDDVVIEVPINSLYLSVLRHGGHMPHRTAKDRQWRSRPDSREAATGSPAGKGQEIDVVFDSQAVTSAEGGRTSALSSTGGNSTSETGFMRVKFLGFHENYRPPYYGTWRKRPNRGECSSKNPFGKTSLLNYEVDSEDEWEEEPDDGDECGSDEEDPEAGEELVDQDDPEEQDGFFVDHGYLSDDEGVESDDDQEMREAAASSFTQANGMSGISGEEDAESHRERMRMEAKVWKDKMQKKRRVEPLKLFAIPPTFASRARLVGEDREATDQFLAHLSKFRVIKCGN